MKKQNWKKVISLIVGSLVIALVVSILPGSFLVNAAELSRSEAKQIALEEIADDNEDFDEKDVVEVKVRKYTPDNNAPYYKVTVITDEKEYVVELLVETQKVDSEEEAEKLAIAEIEKVINEKIGKNDVVNVDDGHADDVKTPYYTVKIVIDNEDEYVVRVYINTGKVVIVTSPNVDDKEEPKQKQDKIPEGFDVVKDFDDFKDYVNDYDVDDNDYTDYSKPTDQAELNMFLRDAKKFVMSEFDDKDDLKEAKNVLKEVKKEFKNDIKDEKKEEPEKVNDKLVNNVKLSKKQVLLIALQKVGLPIDSADLAKFEKAEKISNFEEIFKIDDLDITLEDGKNPTVYKIEFEYKNYEYKIEINATSGKILEYKRESLKAEEIDDEDEVKDDEPGKGNSKGKDNNKGNKKN